MDKGKEKKKADRKGKAGKSTYKNSTEEENFAHESKAKAIFLSLIPYLLGVAALFIAVCFIFRTKTGIVGKFTADTLYGLFSGAAWLVPVLIVNTLVFWKTDKESGNLLWKMIDSFIVLSLISVAFFYFFRISGEGSQASMSIAQVWSRGESYYGGGIIGGYTGWLFYKCLGKIGSPIILSATLIIFAVFLFGLTPKDAWFAFRNWIRAIRRKRREGKILYYNKPEPEPERRISEPDRRIAEPERPVAEIRKRSDFDPDIPVGSGAEAKSEAPSIPTAAGRHSEPPVAPTLDKNGISRETLRAERKTPYGREIDLDAIFYPEKTAAVPNSTPVSVPYGGTDTEVSDTVDESNLTADNLPLETTAETEATTAEPQSDLEVQITRRRLITKVVRGEGGADADITEESIPKKEYVFPPLTLLKADTGRQNTDISEEITITAQKLVDTLTSFKVRTRVVNVSRGPTITRYELAPEEGVRVRAISALADDISLSLASKTGVRIEAPIPGKAAVGIEVPNRKRETVYLRSLLSDDRFVDAKPRLTAALGVDVAGDPVFMNIADMPHILIAGTTGSGKSVCMNCLILSVLYKATPDEAKMIMIDPKKVEFNVYNGLPHLIVPVVTNVKKAAGALAWATAEMERRYETLEAVGVRDLNGYNIATADDPEKEYMPQIMVVIDELADLMMTAPAEVEDYICRIAQKGRACGIHLIIGTQRPSVDVITGLIKANVPSRIAFTVSSQVDSRTIIDIAGAEKLCGRGDMLFAPLGLSKPMRVQGAFVSDSEVAAITGYITENSSQNEYDSEVMDDIERQAELCGTKGKKPATDTATDAGDEESDPMLDAAIDLAMESGKISTSLIQRRLSLGYGRAAKLIDSMEKMGIVSPPEGQKPRNVLISVQEWSEIKMRRTQ